MTETRLWFRGEVASTHTEVEPLVLVCVCVCVVACVCMCVCCLGDTHGELVDEGGDVEA